jgi:hypothetical protein
MPRLAEATAETGVPHKGFSKDLVRVAPGAYVRNAPPEKLAQERAVLRKIQARGH